MRILRSLSSCTVVGLTAAVFCVSAAGATVPEDRTITYSFREDPQDAESVVVFRMMLKLTAVDNDASTVGWLIESIEYAQLDEFGDPVSTWGIDYPELDTPDGLWWVTHGNVLDPQPQEFAAPPTLEGTAAAEDPSDPDLNYFVQTGSCTGGCSSLFSGRVTALNHEFVAEGESQPVEEGDDEPAEIDEDENPG